MKKLLMTSAAVCGLVAFTASDAHAQIEVSVGGHTKNYVGWSDQDTFSTPAAQVGATTQDPDERSFDILRESELHFDAVGLADNGLEYGFHVELDVDTTDNAATDESYVFLSGDWGRINLGGEDGAAYLLQVAAPSADSNIDGLRQFVQPVNYTLTDFANINRGVNIAAPAAAINLTGVANTSGSGTAGGINGGLLDVDGSGAAATANDVIFASAPNGDTTAFATSGLFRFDYDNSLSSDDEKITYLSPIMNGFQIGASYTPESGNSAGATADGGTRSVLGFNDDDDEGDYGSVYEISARYEGTFNNVGIAVGGGFAQADLEAENLSLGATAGGAIAAIDVDGSGTFTAGDTVLSTLDDRQQWNVGIDLDIGAFGLGAVYLEDDLGLSSGGDQDTIVVGIDYTTGPFKLGASWLNQDQETDGLFGNAFDEIETDRYTAGVIYTAAEGLTFRGSVSHIEHEVGGTAISTLGLGDTEATSVLGGVQFNF